MEPSGTSISAVSAHRWRLPAEELTQHHLERALLRARSQLLSRQREDGHWRGELEGDSILETEYVLLLQFLGRGQEPRCHQAAEYVRRQQLPDGGWSIYPGGPADVSASVKAYLVLKLCGDSPDSPQLSRARKRIHALGGAGAVNSFTRFFLALLGECSWDKCPAVPPELTLLPNWATVSPYAMSAWSRTIVVPLSILWAKKPTRPLPAHARCPELWVDGAPALPARVERMRGRLWRNAFGQLDRGLKFLERHQGLRITRRPALQEAERWLLDHLHHSEGLGAIFPSMVYSVFALVALGYSPQHPLVQAQLGALERLEVKEGSTLRLQPCLSPVWDTALALNALASSGLSPDDPDLLRAAGWLLSKEIRMPGDWRVRNPSAPIGGWYFEYANEFYPDCDDTAQVLTALSRLSFPQRQRGQFDAARERGVAWLLSMQCPDGGWAAFDRDCMNEVLTFVPFADHNAMLDPSCPDITGRVLETLRREGLGPKAPAVRRAVRYLRRTQHPDGSWYGRWGCNYLYGTYLALWGLRAVGEDLRQARYQRAADWVRSVQNPDGGWGESYRSYDDPSHKGKGESTAAQSAWALMALWATGDRHSPALRRGVRYLLETQANDGTWHDRAWTGTGFPRVFYLRYELYDDYFPLQALATVRWEGPREWPGGEG